MGFPGASTDRAAARYAVVGAPLDASTTFIPGARFGPRRIREFATPFDDYDHRTDSQFTELGVHDHGDLRAWPDIPAYLEYVTNELRELVRSDVLPLLVGGEHTVSTAGVRAVEPDVFVCLDAHLDLRAEYDGAEWHHATTTRRVLETVDDAVILGARTGSEAEWERAAANDVTVVPPSEVPAWDPDVDGAVYLSVDIDAADPSVAPGTGTMEPFGVSSRTLRDIVRAVAPQSVAFDVVEVNDRDAGQTAALAAKLLREFVYTHAAANSR